jgi:hypothetical protein
VKILKTAIVVVLLAGSLPFCANADFDYPRLPWYEKFFFPLGVKFSYELPLIPDDGDWSAWNYR